MLELWAEHEGFEFKEYTVETISASEQTNKNFLKKIGKNKNAAYSGSLVASRKYIKRLYGKDVKIVESTEVAEQEDKGTNSE